MTVLILQSRLDSSRLPRKALLEIAPGLSLLEAVFAQLSAVDADERVLACPHDSLEAFAPRALNAGWRVFAGDKDDVLGRYEKALRSVDGFGERDDDLVLRATGDNPFVLVQAANALARDFFISGADYACYEGLPHGSGLEYLRATALFEAASKAAESYEREHVCPYLYRRPESFAIHRPALAQELSRPKLRLTVDTIDDFIFARRLWDKLKGPCHDDHRLVHTALQLAGGTQ